MCQLRKKHYFNGLSYIQGTRWDLMMIDEFMGIMAMGSGLYRIGRYLYGYEVMGLFPSSG